VDFNGMFEPRPGIINGNLVKTKLPVMGPVFLRIFMSRFTRMFVT